MKKFSQLIVSISWCVVILSGTLQNAYAQQNAVDTLSKKFDSYRKQNLQEKVYVHLDRPSYLTGETMWFKIYLTDGSLHKPSKISKVVYVEFIDRNNQSVLKTKVEVKDGLGSGSLYLPATLNNGNYILRAYTNWMKNFSAEFYFHQPVSIINPFRNIDAESQSTVTSYDAQFFPEGGNLINDIKSKVAFRIVDASGNGVALKGVIINQQNDTLVHFTPLHFGIGSFYFTTQNNNQYRALLRDHSGKLHTFKLPVALNTGYTMHVLDTTSDQLQIKINANLSDDSTIPGVYLFVHSRNVTIRAIFKTLHNGSTTFLIDKNELMDGISHMTVFDSSMKPVCERLYFKQPENILTLSVKSGQPQYEPRRLVKIDLSSTLKEKATPSNLSVSVFKVDSLPAFTGNIVDYFWLTSDLKGTIESPEYYFSKSPDTKQAVDNLMLTHGWRRFQWNDVLSNKGNKVSFIPEYRGHIVQGSVLKEDGSAAAGIVAYLSFPGKIIRLYPSRSNEKGEVQFEMENFHGSSKIIAQTNTKKDTAYSVKIQSPFSNQFATRQIPLFKISNSIENQLVSRSVAMQVQDIYLSNISGKIKTTQIDSTAFYGKADETYRLDDYTRFPVMEEVMREYVPGVLVRKRRDGFHFIVLDDLNKSAFDESPLVLLDGVPVFNEDEIMAFSPLQIKKLEVVRKRWQLGSMSFAGIVSYTTYQGDLNGFQLHPKCVTLNYEGLQLQREFYSPLYEKKDQRESRIPDQRHLLFWNPMVTTDDLGHQHFEFYTSDIPGEFKIVVEGMTKDGSVGTASSTFTVKELNN